MSTTQVAIQSEAIEQAARTAARAANHVIDRLIAFDAHGEFVLTAYLEIDASTPLGRHPEVQLAAQLERYYDAGLSVKQLAQEQQRVLSEIREPAGGARGLVVFASAPANLFSVARLPVALRPAVFWDTRPHLRPLLAIIDEYEKSLVVLADKQNARFFRVFLDRIEEVSDVWDRVPPHHAQGAEAQSNIARHHDEKVKWHLRRVCNVLGQIVDEERVDRIVLGGPPEALAALEHLLPRRLLLRLAGTIHCSVFAAPDQILLRARAALEQAERASETQTVARVLEAHGQQQAALGLNAVAEAVAAGQVLVFLADAEKRPPGFVCGQCELLLPELNGGICPACSGSVRAVPDLVEHLAERVLQQGGRFEEVRGTASERLDPFGGVAALLRYPVPHAVEG
jgi:peptide chain release factor subunit 1